MRSLFLLLLVPNVYACSCVSLMTTCERGWTLGETIFLGTVTTMEKLPIPEPRTFLASNAAHFTVEESYRGAQAPGKEIVIETGMGGGDCGYPFVPGLRYVVYATTAPDGKLHTGTCTQTMPAVMAAGTIRELRALRDHARFDDVFGTVVLSPEGNSYESLSEAKPIQGVTVHATANGKTFSTRSDAEGAYVFPTLLAGKYEIEWDLPAGLQRPQPFPVEAGNGCRVELSAKPDGRIEGTVVDSNGNPVSGFVTIEPSDPVEAKAARTRGGLPGDEVQADGKFKLPQLPPGSYRLIYRTNDFRKTFYGPVIELSLGQHTNVQFKLRAP